MAAPSFPPGCAKRFRQERLLGSGGFGAVYLATDRTLERPAVVKLLHVGLGTDNEAVRRFRNEAKVTAALRHAAIVVVFAHDVEAGVPWIAYELLEGSDLRAVLAADGPSWQLAAAAGQAVAGALHEAHSHGILHRDLKPDNVMRLAAGGFKLMDFGIARWEGRTTVETAAGMLVGTPVYMAPELFQGSAATAASDLYSLGVMLFELSTGEAPFTGDLSAVISAHVRERPPGLSKSSSEVPRAFETLVLELLAKDPAERPSDAGAVASRLAQLNAPSVPRSDATGRSSQAARAIATQRVAPARPAPRLTAARFRSTAIAMVAAVLLAGVVAIRLFRSPPTVAFVRPSIASSPPAVALPGRFDSLRNTFPDPLDLLRPRCFDGAQSKRYIERAGTQNKLAKGRTSSLVRAMATIRGPGAIPTETAENAWNVSSDLIKIKDPSDELKQCAMRVKAYLCLGKESLWEEARWIYTELLKVKPNDDAAVVGLALAYSHLRDTSSGAEAAIRAGLERYPQCMSLHEGLLSLLVTGGRFQDALAADAALPASIKEAPEIEVIRARMLMYQRRRPEAKKVLGLLAIGYPEKLELQQAIGWSLIDGWYYEDAVAVADRALKISPTSSALHNIKWSALNAKKDHEKALEAADRAINDAPDDFWAYERKGASHWELNQYQDALTAFENAMDKLPKQGPAHRVVETLEKLGRFEVAIRYADRMLVAGDEGLHKAPRARLACSLGYMYLRRKELENATRMFSEARKLDSANTLAIAGQARVLFISKNHEAALAALSEAARIEPTAAWIPVQLAEMSLDLGRLDEARKHLNRAWELDHRSKDAEAFERRLESALKRAQGPVH